jgi:hypothetical protein
MVEKIRFGLTRVHGNAPIKQLARGCQGAECLGGEPESPSVSALRGQSPTRTDTPRPRLPQLFLGLASAQLGVLQAPKITALRALAGGKRGRGPQLAPSVRGGKPLNLREEMDGGRWRYIDSVLLYSIPMLPSLDVTVF